ncbi:hypothetical protein [Nonlabens sp. Asnod3-A02]|uniref:Uncharacterized protein n=2 Tax=Flavobacteriaceae TaxID=49546 RepID=A0A2S6ISA1_9FLAO|nr:hypothetical protein LY01_00971 [Nonlabens xylanidelens]PQJ13822.1 hypothetical protein BST94_15925 [Nonlabens xylanidelens]
MGLIANAIGTYLYIILITPYEFEEALVDGYREGFLGKLIVLGAIFNLVLFFFFLTGKIGKFKKPIQEYEARGVVMATMLAGIAGLMFNFIL